MPTILQLETATHNCAVAVAVNGQCIAHRHEASEKYIHAEKLHVFIAEAMREVNLQYTDLDAVAVSNGPGSYTGLRIGISAAKGLCFALGKPLIAINTTEVLAQAAQKYKPQGAVLAVIDARRNEVYAQLFSADMAPQTPVEAVIVTAESWPTVDAQTLVIGDAAQKTADLLGRKVRVAQQLPSADDMTNLALQRFCNSQFVDVAYHEPFYLKDFVAGKPKKIL